MVALMLTFWSVTGVVLQLLFHGCDAVHLVDPRDGNLPGGGHENFLVLPLRNFRMHVRWRRLELRHRVLNVHHALVALLSGHEFLNHSTVALIHRRLVRIAAINLIQRLVRKRAMLVLVVGHLRRFDGQLGQQKFLASTRALGNILVGQATRRQHAVVEVDAGFWGQ